MQRTMMRMKKALSIGRTDAVTCGRQLIIAIIITIVVIIIRTIIMRMKKR